MADQLPFDRVSRSPRELLDALLYLPAATQNVEVAHDSLLKDTEGSVPGGSGVLGRGACVDAQPVVGTIADAVPVVANSPPNAPAPMARAPSAATTAERRSFDGVT